MKTEINYIKEYITKKEKSTSPTHQSLTTILTTSKIKIKRELKLQKHLTKYNV